MSSCYKKIPADIYKGRNKKRMHLYGLSNYRPCRGQPGLILGTFQNLSGSYFMNNV